MASCSNRSPSDSTLGNESRWGLCAIVDAALHAFTRSVQSGHRVSGARWVQRWKTPLQSLLKHYETGGGRHPPDPDIVTKHDQAIAKYGDGVIDRNTEVQWNYDIQLDTVPYQ